MYRYLILIFISFFLNASTLEPLKFRVDSSVTNIAKPLHPKSHINVYLPSIPYSYIAKNTNAGLIRSYDNKRGWEYDLAKEHRRVDDYTYVIKIRENLKFQNGTSFTIDSVIKNLNFFKKNPFLYTNIDKINFDVKKIDKLTIEIKLDKKYEMFFLDLARIYFYTDEYLEKYASKGGETGSANAVPGPFGMGPYILESGYALGTKQSSKLELVANPNYWSKEYPKIKRVTVFTQLNVNSALNEITNFEGKLDISPIPFNKKIDVLLSKYSKLVIRESTNNFAIFFNLINGNKFLKNKEVRIALNEAINQENLLNFVYKREGKISPFATSVNYDIVKKIASKKRYKKVNISEKRKHELLNGLELKVLTQDRFMFLWKGIEFQLKKYGVRLNYMVTSSEKDIYDQLLTTHNSKNGVKWDFLTWGDDDWYYQNPWTMFFIYENNSAWSTIGHDAIMGEYISKYFQTKVDSKEYENIVEKILYRARDMAYTLRVPSPNKVIAVNKEVIYRPYVGGMIPLWKIQISNNHWSVRKNKEYPVHLQKPIKTQRVKNEIFK